MSAPLRIVTQAESWKQEVQTDVVERLSDLLDRAKAGEIQGIAYSAYCKDEMVLVGYTKNTFQTAVIGGLERIKHRMLASES